MNVYPTPGAVDATPSVPSLTKLFARLRAGSLAPVLNLLWVPAVSAALIVIAGAVGAWLKQPWLFAGLAPTIVMVAANPGHESSSFRAIVVGHLAAIACGYLALLLLNATGAPTLIATRVVPWDRVWASAAAMALLVIVQPQLKAFHPPAAATALLVTLGAYRMTGKTPLALVGGVVLIAVLAEVLKRVRPRGR
ncbi:MAG: HPP family protein [Gemmatimonadaceae bacterium]